MYFSSSSEGKGQGGDKNFKPPKRVGILPVRKITLRPLFNIIYIMVKLDQSNHGVVFGMDAAKPDHMFLNSREYVND
jgi:hypothetical protein